jgi:hypothetical protein
VSTKANENFTIAEKLVPTIQPILEEAARGLASFFETSKFMFTFGLLIETNLRGLRAFEIKACILGVICYLLQSCISAAGFLLSRQRAQHEGSRQQ